MKQFITLLAVAGIMASCSTKPSTPIGTAANTIISPDQAAEFAAYQQWKSAQASEETKDAEVASAEPVTRIVYVPQAPVTRTVVKEVSAPVAQPVPTPATVETPPVVNPTQQDETVATPTTLPQEQEQKKGWSKPAKGAVIGAGVGAAAGAVIGKKNRVLGAVIGGVAGGGVGYGIGKVLEKKDGK